MRWFKIQYNTVFQSCCHAPQMFKVMQKPNHGKSTCTGKNCSSTYSFWLRNATLMSNRLKDYNKGCAQLLKMMKLIKFLTCSKA